VRDPAGQPSHGLHLLGLAQLLLGAQQRLLGPGAARSDRARSADTPQTLPELSVMGDSEIDTGNSLRSPRIRTVSW